MISIAAARVQAQTSAPNFPSNPEAWINSGPISTESLKGKAAFIWFFEEDCPRCRERWPGLLETARNNAGKPILFMAVNSGSSRADVQSYAQQNRINWPILVDPNRQFERLCEVNEISLQNIYQVRLLMPDGSLERGNFSDIEASVATALKGAAWKVDPTTIPAVLQSAWLSIEMGDYATSSKLVTKNLTSSKPDIKEAAEALHAAVKKEIDAQAGEARTVFDAGSKWKAYRAYQAIAQRFAGYDLPEEVAANTKTLTADSQVKAGLVAAKNLELAKKALQGSAASGRKRGLAMLDKIIADVPNTDLADEAVKLQQQYGK